MKIIIMGCGRVGEQLTRLLSSEGHAISVIDYDARALERLGPDVHCEKIRGVGFDRDILLRAGIEQAEGFVAASASDNANIVAARTARTIFHVPRVVARLYDPRRAEIYRRLGLITISMTSWGAERIRELLVYAEMEPVLAFGNGEVFLTNLEISATLQGRRVRDLQVPGELQVAAIIREGQAMLPVSGAELRSGDQVQIVVLASAIPRLKALLGLSEGV